MKSMIVVACLALACGAHASGWAGPPANIALSQDGRNILDTPEVAQARAAHLAALSQANQNNPNPQDDGSYDPRWDNEEYWQGAEQNKWNAPAPQQWNAPAHNQWNAAPAHQQWNAPSQWNGAPSWQAPQAQHQPANIRLANDGSGILDTPEVAAARAAHLAAHAQVAHAAPAHAPQQHW